MNKRDFATCRSNGYQWIIQEVPEAPDILTEYSDNKGLTGKLNNSTYCEELYELEDRLRVAQWRIIDSALTPRQRQVLKLYSDGYTQMDIAKMLKVNQSSITKSINGNCDYRNGKKIYGGAKKKLKRAAAKDPEIQEILKRMAEIAQEI